MTASVLIICNVPERTAHVVQHQDVISKHVADLLLRGSCSFGGK